MELLVAVVALVLVFQVVSEVMDPVRRVPRVAVAAGVSVL